MRKVLLTTGAAACALVINAAYGTATAGSLVNGLAADFRPPIVVVPVTD
jgi:hypothetical protein